jgi:diguanylate cyclase
MVRGVIDVSRALGLTTIAEGVERPDQLAMLQELGCDNAQGFLFDEPMPSGDFEHSLARRAHAERTMVDGPR